MKSVKSYICGCAYNVESHLKDVFKNIEIIISMLDDFYIIIAYDESEDNTLDILHQIMDKYPENMEIVRGNKEMGNIRTQNISNARNELLNTMNQLQLEDFDYFIMMDMDEVCSGKMNPFVLKQLFETEKDNKPLPWDCLSFNRVKYYDLWALSIEPYSFSCNHYLNRRKVQHMLLSHLKEEMGRVIIEKTNEGLLPCISAFNGFAIYRINKFSNIQYEWNIHKTLTIFPKHYVNQMSQIVKESPISRHDDCEHRYFHIRASQLNKARICITPMCLF